jgi:hypothetical protein
MVKPARRTVTPNGLAGTGRVRACAQRDTAILLHKHGVRDLRHGRPGQDADRFAWLPCGLGVPYCDHPARDGELHLAVLLQISMAHGVAVDRGIVERRQIDRSHRVVCEDASARAGAAPARSW